VEPTHDEPICLVSFELAHIRLGGGPWNRKSFWKAYREELDLNRRTQYRNEHIRICRPVMRTLHLPPGEPVFFRDGALTRPGLFEPELER
jgi:hypothetical protein